MRLLFLITLLTCSVTHSKEAIKSFIDEALNSDSINELVVAGYLAKSHELSYSNEQLYSKAIAIDPNNFMLLEQMSRFCKDSHLCKNPIKYLKRLERADPDNAVPNFYSAVYLAKQKKYSQALKQIKKAVKKKTYHDYNWDRFFLIDKVLSHHSFDNNASKQTAIKSLYIDFANEPMVKIKSLCVNQSKVNSEWVEPCIALGKLMETSSTMILSTFIGFAVQRDVLALDKNRVIEYENVKQRRDVFHQFRVRVMDNIEYASLGPYTDYDKVPKSFYDDMKKFGEKVALQRVLDANSGK